MPIEYPRRVSQLKVRQPSPLTEERAKAGAPEHEGRRRAEQQDGLVGLRLGKPATRGTNRDPRLTKEGAKAAPISCLSKVEPPSLLCCSLFVFFVFLAV